MTKILFALAVTLLVATNVLAKSAGESVPVQCSAEPLDLSSTAWTEKMLSIGSFRLAVDPDTSRGPVTAVTLENGKIRDPANPTNDPYVLVAVGDQRRSCSLRVSFAQCPMAAEVVEQLKQASLPLGLGSDSSSGALLVLHGSTYHVEAMDGFGNHHRLELYEAGHPLEDVIKRSVDSLESCIRPVADAYHGG